MKQINAGTVFLLIGYIGAILTNTVNMFTNFTSRQIVHEIIIGILILVFYKILYVNFTSNKSNDEDDHTDAWITLSIFAFGLFYWYSLW